LLFLASAIPSLASAATDPTAEEQYLLELINRTRWNPDAEVFRLSTETWGDTGSPATPDLNEGINNTFLFDDTRQPLAFNRNIIQAARDYSNTLLNNNAFEHEFGGTNPRSRMEAAGYVFTPSFSLAENLAFTGSTGPHPINQGRADQHHEALFIDGDVGGRGHRRNILITGVKEIGIGMAAKPNYDPPPPGGQQYNAVISTYNFAFSSAPPSNRPFFTGVVYSDAVSNDNFYNVGEGLAGVTVTAIGAPINYTTTTLDSGGYSLPVPAGTYAVTFSGGPLATPITYSNVTIGTTNKKLDAGGPFAVWNTDANGMWVTPASWSGSPPLSTGAIAVFGSRITAPRTVNTDGGATAGTLLFDSAHRYTVTGVVADSPVTLDIGSGNAKINVENGSHTIAARLNLADPLDVTVLRATDRLDLNGDLVGAAHLLTKFGKGTLRLAGDESSFSRVSINDGTLLIGHRTALGAGPVALGWGSNDTSLFVDSPVIIPNNVVVQSGSGPRRLGGVQTTGLASFAGTVTLEKAVTLSQVADTTTIMSGLFDNQSAAQVAKTGPGTISLQGSQSWGAGTSFVVTEGRLRFLLSLNNSVSIGAGSLITVNPGATLELAGDKSALASGNVRANVINNSSTSLLVTGTNQIIGNLDGSGATVVSAASDLTATHIRQGGLSVADGGAKLTVPANGGNAATSVLGTIDISSGGVLDLTNNDLIIRATQATTSAVHSAAQADIASAQNGVDANFVTTWDGPGIASSSARTANVTAGFDLIGLGAIRNSDLDVTTGVPGSAFTTFSGQPVTLHDVLVKYTYTGDGNLDGAVTFDDYAAMDSAFFGLIPNLGWATGDINFDDEITFDDYSVVDQAFFFQGAALSDREPVVAVPEPSAWLLAAITLAVIASVKRRSHVKRPGG
jgi:hypothetical protein